MGSLNDPIADLLTRLRNANRARHRYIDVNHSKMKESIVKILIEKGLIAHYLYKEEKKKGTMRVFLKYASQREPIIRGLQRVSKPSLRKYVSYDQIPRVHGGMGISIVSTSKGILEGDEARQLKVGGELLCLAW
jgi:small subunit ribosomal protein S8